jgi:hypothetical protein
MILFGALRRNWIGDGFQQFQILSDDFIREFQDFVDWEAISQYQILSEELIRDFQYKMNW